MQVVGAWWYFKRDRQRWMANTSSDNLHLQVVGACWYFLSVDRQVTCWRYNCQDEVAISCKDAFFDCSSLDGLAAARSSWEKSSNITKNCDNSNPFFNYGIYTNAINNGITTSNMKFMVKYFYCVWIGLLGLRWVPCYLLVEKGLL
jgi:cyclic nucleotide gated channel